MTSLSSTHRGYFFSGGHERSDAIAALGYCYSLIDLAGRAGLSFDGDREKRARRECVRAPLFLRAARAVSMCAEPLFFGSGLNFVVFDGGHRARGVHVDDCSSHLISGYFNFGKTYIVWLA